MQKNVVVFFFFFFFLGGGGGGGVGVSGNCVLSNINFSLVTLVAKIKCKKYETLRDRHEKN